MPVLNTSDSLRQDNPTMVTHSSQCHKNAL